MMWIIFVFPTEHLQQVEITLNVVFAKNHPCFMVKTLNDGSEKSVKLRCYPLYYNVKFYLIKINNSENKVKREHGFDC
jgi:hypothetical protein